MKKEQISELREMIAELPDVISYPLEHDIQLMNILTAILDLIELDNQQND